MLAQFGHDPADLHPVRRLREAHRAMRSLLDTGAVELDGDSSATAGCSPGTARRKPRAAAVGRDERPLVLRLAGEVADGVYAACSFSHEALTFLIDNVRIGAERAGRDLAQLDLCVSLTAAVADDPLAARRAARLKAAFYLPSMPQALIERHGFHSARSHRSAPRSPAAISRTRYAARRTSSPIASASQARRRRSPTGSTASSCLPASTTCRSRSPTRRSRALGPASKSRACRRSPSK